jgi:hypothetical protein
MRELCQTSQTKFDGSTRKRHRTTYKILIVATSKILAGSGPLNKLFEKSAKSSASQLPKISGIGPENSLLLNLIISVENAPTQQMRTFWQGIFFAFQLYFVCIPHPNVPRLEGKVSGSGPVKKFSLTLKSDKAVNLPICVEIVPFRELKSRRNKPKFALL